MLLLALKMKKAATYRQPLEAGERWEMAFPPASRRKAALQTHFSLLTSDCKTLHCF